MVGGAGTAVLACLSAWPAEVRGEEQAATGLDSILLGSEEEGGGTGATGVPGYREPNMQSNKRKS